MELKTDLSRLGRQYRSLYRDFEVEHPGKAGIRIEVRKSPFSWRHRRRFEVLANGRTLFQPDRWDSVVPHVEWAIGWELPESLPQHLQLHASSLEVNGTGVIFPGHAGAGKSTLTLGMLTRGWRYLCDEFALIDRDSKTLAPYPRAICIKEGSFGVVKELSIPVTARQRFRKGAKGWVDLVHPNRWRDDATGSSCPPRFVIFPGYRAGAAPMLTRMSRAEAVLALHEVCFNLLPRRDEALCILTDVVRQATCFRLISGEIQRTCDLVERAIQSG
jgi:HprK-related kinase A